jgi:prepilin peptidase CpaA
VGGWHGLLLALAGAGIALGLLLPGWLLKWMGAGDVKLMAALGAWLAFPQAVMAVLASLIAGGLISVIVSLRHGKFVEMLRNAAWIGAWGLGARRGKTLAPPITTGVRFPFALAVLAGSTFALWVRP